ncbi:MULTISPECIES: imidazole glycerol phosphate synthase subunit HisH [Hyphobacterium]|uniref:Imidazole glycerol phosphate synthase subunit HisH n=1 Tax=Hyphobacterium vulgare TaxID=1736751 RepID=A0ABV6ZTM1_9PROT
MSVALIDTGCSNLFSVQAALDRLGAAHALARTPDEAFKADRLILPGVGAAGPAMDRLSASGWDDALRTESRPLLGICLGMQLLFERSEEGDVETLGLIPGTVRRLPRPDGGVWPHMGWSRLRIERSSPLTRAMADGAYAYFVHGFAAGLGAATLASAGHGLRFSAIVQQGNVFGCQFHPERSAAIGSTILRNFIELSDAALSGN